MSGVVGTVGGWFASSIISKVIDAAASYFGNNYDLQRGTRDALTSLKISLPQILAAIELASRRPITNRGLITWLNDLKNAAYEAEDVLDDLEAKRIRESLKGKNKVIEIASSSGTTVKTVIFSDKELEGLKSSLQKLSEISKGVEPFIALLKLEYSINIKTQHTDCYRSETSSNLDPNAKIFGRDEELNFILDMIFSCQLMFSTEGNSEPESQPTPPSEGESKLPDPREVVETSSFTGNEKGTIGKRKWFSGKNSEVGQVGKNKEVSNVKSSVGVENSVCIRNWKLPVLPIFGLGGVGKTTIAKMVYNNRRVTEGFDLKAWVYVPENFDIRRIMCDIQFSLRGCSSVDTMMNLETIEWKLIETIKNKRLFLVLDGVHDGIESIWAGLLSVLSKGEPGSFVLVTTQSERVAKTIGNMPNIITVDVLGSECFKELFEYYAFGEFKLLHMEKQPQVLNLEEEELRTLKMIATKIATKLHGLPLAGVVIGKMLHTRIEREYWEEIMKSNWWDDEFAVEGILPSLGIGYMNLDPELKQCFAFCSIFPKHYVFSRNILVQMWMAHCFIQPNDNETYKLEIGEIRLEDLGSKRFDKLMDRSFFQATIFDDKYIMHDLIRDLAIAVSSNEFCYVKSLENYLPSIARHLAINCDGSNIEGINHNNTALRTMILFGNWKNCTDESISNILRKSNGLRLLDLSYIGFKTNTPIVSICQLPHLRFVDLSFSGIELIPDKFCELWHLQVLDVRGCNFQKLPKDMNKLINLRHLYASAETVSLIFGIGKLTNLQELEKFLIGMSEGYRITELRHMNEIRGNLILTNLQNVSSKEEALASQLTKKKYLKRLELKFLCNKDESTTREEVEVLDGLKPSLSIEMLSIQGWRGQYLPGWISSKVEVSNLKYIKLRTFIMLSTLPAFGELPSLEFLSLYDLPCIKKVGDEFYGNSDVLFPSLKELTFNGMSCLRAWSDAPAGKKSFPHLRKIHFEYCQELMELATNISTSSILELKLLECPKIHNIATVLQCIPSVTHLSIDRCCNDLYINCKTLRFLEVLSLKDVNHLCLVGGLKSLVNLRRLIISGTGEFKESFGVEQEHDEIQQENQMQCLQFLTYLQLGDRYGGTHCLSAVGKVPSLRTLLIRQFPAEAYTREEESWFPQLTSLEELIFYQCWKLRHLPSTLPMLSSLKKLTIVSCESISSLPEAGLPQNLISLCITSCSHELANRCQPNVGDDWHKIYHIPQVRINTSWEYYDINHFKPSTMCIE